MPQVENSKSSGSASLAAQTNDLTNPKGETGESRHANNNNITTESVDGKIFKSREDINIETLKKWPSLGHYMCHMLENENSDVTIFLDTNSGRRWTGAEVREKMLNVASALIHKHGLNSGDSVCIHYDNSDLSCILALGIICAGGFVACAYQKDPYPEVLYLARKVEPKLLFCHERNLNWAQQLSDDLNLKVTGVQMDNCGGSSRETIMDFLNYDYKQAKCPGQVPVACKNKKYHTAVVTMSAGTTGRPKVVPVTHWNSLAFLFGRTGQARGSHWISSTSLDYVIGRLLILGAIRAGYTLVIMNGFESKTYLEVIEKYKVNSIAMGVAAFYNLITYPELEKFNITSVRYVLAVGSKLTYVDELRDFLSKHPHISTCRLGYGSSEISSCSGYNMKIEEYSIESNKAGKLNPNIQAKIIDPETGKLLGCNQEGLLFIKSNTTFPGYFDLEAARAIKANKPCAFVSTRGLNLYDEDDENVDLVTESGVWPLVCGPETFDQDGFYRTGDLAYFNSDEELCIVGRYDEVMCCLHARKVLPQEFEEILLEHPSVLKVCVIGIAHKKEPELQCPRAFVVPKSTEQIKLTGAKYEPEDEKEKNLQFKGVDTLSGIEDEKRRLLAVDLMNHIHIQVGWIRHLTGGIVILGDIPLAKSNGKMDKGFLRSLTTERVEFYGDRSE